MRLIATEARHYTRPQRTGTSRSSSCCSRRGPLSMRLIATDIRHYTGPQRTGTSRSLSCCSRRGPLSMRLIATDIRHYTGPQRTGTSRLSNYYLTIALDSRINLYSLCFNNFDKQGLGGVVVYIL
jgi:ABC-type cobalamin transport system ATPase subunit